MHLNFFVVVVDSLFIAASIVYRGTVFGSLFFKQILVSFLVLQSS